MSKSQSRSVGYRSKKRRFCGNQHTNKDEPTACKSASAKKLKLSLDVSQSLSDETNFKGYRLFDLNILTGNSKPFLL